jgi:hypothetical protein
MSRMTKDRLRANQRWEFDHLVAKPADPDDAVAVLRWNVACFLDHFSVEQIAESAGVRAGRLRAFLEADAATAGELLTLAEVAGLLRVVEARIEDREIVAELEEYERVAKPYVEAAEFDFGLAMRRAVEVRDAFRSSNPTASRWGDDHQTTVESEGMVTA